MVSLLICKDILHFTQHCTLHAHTQHEMRHHVVRFLLETEQSYVQSLRTVIKVSRGSEIFYRALKSFVSASYNICKHKLSQPTHTHTGVHGAPSSPSSHCPRRTTPGQRHLPPNTRNLPAPREVSRTSGRPSGGLDS